MKVPFFSELPKRHVREIARTAWISEFPEQAVICREGSVESAFYVLINGRARLERSGRKTARLSAGEFFGEISLLDPGPRTASVIGETPVRCVQLVGSDFRAMLAKEPLLASRVAIGLARRLRRVERPRVE